MKASPPLRFLALVLGGWLCVRAAVLAPGWWIGQSAANAPPTPGHAPRIASARPPAAQAAVPRPPAYLPPPAPPPSPATSPRPGSPSLIRHVSYKTEHLLPRMSPPALLLSPLLVEATSPDGPVPAQALVMNMPWSPPAAPGRAGRPGRWSGSAWLLVRHDRPGAALAPGGTLGGSQTGARLLFGIGGGLALSARAYVPLRQIRGAEAAMGLDWRPAARLPVHLLAERRQDVGGDGRSAFALSLYGGGSRSLPHRLRLDLYGQAGIVGARSRDMFADGAARLSVPAGPIEIGGGAWGGAQPGAARLDAGPSISWRLPIAASNLRLQADWRFRVAGDAAPGSGPALTLASDF
jgi:hypothetical protein